MTQNICTKEVKHTLFANAYQSSSKTEHMLGHKTSLQKYKKIEMISNIFSRHKCVKLEIKYKRNTGKFAIMRRLNNMLLNIMGHGRNQIQNFEIFGTLLVVQRLRICLAMQGT